MGVVTPHSRRDLYVEQSAWLSLGANLVIVAVKLAAGVASGSISVLGEGLQSTVDVVASAMIVWTVQASRRPPDRQHPWGHGKLEPMAALAQMALILLTCGGLLLAAWNRWREPSMPRVDYGIWAMLFAVVVDGLVARRLHRVARETGSEALRAEALHLQSDLLAALGLIIGLVLVAVTGQPRLDPLLAAGMTVVVIVTALRTAIASFGPLLDERLPRDEEERIRGVLDEHPEVRGYHRLRTRRSGHIRHVDLHLLLDDHLTFAQAHAVTEEVEEAIRRSLPAEDVTVHMEPFQAELEHQEQVHGTPPCEPAPQ